MASLYTLASTYVEIADLLDHEEISDEQRAEMEATLRSLVADLVPEKVEGYCKFIRSIELETVGFKVEEDRLRARRQAREHMVERLKVTLFEALGAMGQQKIVAGTFTVARQKSAPSVAVLDEGAVPAECWKPQPPVLDRKALLDRLKAGEVVPGAELRQSEHLRIR